MQISRVERAIGPKINGHIQRVTHAVKGNKTIQIGETIEHDKVTFREVITKGYNYFKRTFKSFDKNGKVIKGSEYTEELFGTEANSKNIRKFGVIR